MSSVVDPYRVKSDVFFLGSLSVLSAFYIVMIVLLVLANFLYLSKPVQNECLISWQSGTVELEEGGEFIHILDDSGEKLSSHKLPALQRLLVFDEEKINRGQRLTDGELSGTNALLSTLASKEIQYAIGLSLLSCTFSTILSLVVAVPIGYLMSRFEFKGKQLIDGILDIPIVLPPLVIGISLLVLFNFPPFLWISDWVVFEIPAVILAQFMVACAFAVRTMRVTFDRIPQRFEQVAMTLGSNRSQAFWTVILPQARYGVLAAATLAWARSLGEFGPILVFAGSSRMHTEVLPTSVYLELQAGNLKGMLAISIIMIFIACVVLISARFLGMRKGVL